MKRIVVALTFLLATSSIAWAQYNAGKENLAGLTGVRLRVMFGHCPSRNLKNCAEGLDEAQRPEVLKMVEADATAQLQEAGIPLFQGADHRSREAGSPELVVTVTLDKLNGFVHPIVTEVTLLQRVRLVRDPSIEIYAVTWSREGVGAPKLEIPVIQRLVANLIDQFIKDYLSVNPKQSVSSSKDRSKNTKH